MKRKILYILLSLICLISLVACSNEQNTNNNSNTTTNIETNNNDSEKKDNQTKKDETIKSEETTNDGESTTSAQRNVRLYMYDATSDKLNYIDTTIDVKDGAIVTAIINALKEDRGNDYYALDSRIQVASAKLDKDTDTLSVNFGSTFINNLGFGSGVESNILQCVVNSLGYNLGVSKVYITVNGEEYASGHIMLEKGTAFSVDYSNFTKMN